MRDMTNENTELEALGRISFDTSRWPVLIIRYTGESFSDTDLRKHFDEILRFCARGEPISIVSVVAEGVRYTAAQRKAIAQFMTNEPSLRVIRANAIVLRSRIGRGIVTAMEWLVPASSRPFPSHAFAELSDGITWCESMLGKAS